MGSSSCHLRCPSTNPSDNKYLTCRWARKASRCSTWARRCPTCPTGRSTPICPSIGRRSRRCPCSARIWLPRKRKVGQHIPLHSCRVLSAVPEHCLPWGNGTLEQAAAAGWAQHPCPQRTGQAHTWPQGGKTGPWELWGSSGSPAQDHSHPLGCSTASEQPYLP